MVSPGRPRKHRTYRSSGRQPSRAAAAVAGGSAVQAIRLACLSHVSLERFPPGISHSLAIFFYLLSPVLPERVEKKRS